MSELTHICSLLLHCQPSAICAIGQWVNEQPSVDLVAQEEKGRMVLVAECQQDAELRNLIDAIHQLNGVISVNLMYHQMASTASLDEAIEIELNEFAS